MINKDEDLKVGNGQPVPIPNPTEDIERLQRDTYNTYTCNEKSVTSNSGQPQSIISNISNSRTLILKNPKGKL